MKPMFLLSLTFPPLCAFLPSMSHPDLPILQTEMTQLYAARCFFRPSMHPASAASLCRIKQAVCRFRNTGDSL